MYAHVVALQRMDAIASSSASPPGDPDNLEPVYQVLERPTTVLVRLNEHSSFALLLHCCNETEDCHCNGTEYTTSVTSRGAMGSDILKRGCWTVLGSREGYPPRTA